MTSQFTNVYNDDARARAYSELEFPGTYYLAFRDIPGILARYVRGKTALDFGCGAGRSTRFLEAQGYETLGVDISEAMLRQAVERDPEGSYLLVSGTSLDNLGDRSFDLVFSAFTFDNIPVQAARVEILRQLRDRLTPRGRIVNLVSAPEIYINEWASFSTREFPENRNAHSGEIVRITMLDVPDRRPVEDLLWTDADYRESFTLADLEIVAVHKPLGQPTDPHQWISETEIAPWTIYVLRR
jgi:SAM-dependent methyltransferase